MNLISVDKIKLGYNNSAIINGLSFDVDEQDFICIVGHNGSGKTTLIRGILGLIPLMSGKIKFNIDRNQIGYMPQETAVDPNFPASVYEIVLSGTLNNHRNFYNNEDKERADKTLHLLGISDLKNESFSELSGGQRQKILLARTLMATKKILILDEPSNNLDHKSKNDLYRIIKKLNEEQKIAVLMITHDLDHCNLIGNKILSLHNKEYFFGTTEEYIKRVHDE